LHGRYDMSQYLMHQRCGYCLMSMSSWTVGTRNITGHSVTSCSVMQGQVTKYKDSLIGKRLKIQAREKGVSHPHKTPKLPNSPTPSGRPLSIHLTVPASSVPGQPAAAQRPSFHSQRSSAPSGGQRSLIPGLSVFTAMPSGSRPRPTKLSAKGRRTSNHVVPAAFRCSIRERIVSTLASVRVKGPHFCRRCGTLA
jgi:hypothetical protein